MSMAKRELEQHEDMRAAVEALGIEEKALVYDEDSDEVSSAEDEEASPSQPQRGRHANPSPRRSKRPHAGKTA